MNHTPTPLGLKRSFGFGDRLGLAGKGHILSSLGKGFACILAQQSIRELTRTERTPDEVMIAAKGAITATDFQDPWGADADHLKTPEDVNLMHANGFTFFTIDPSEFVNNDADGLNETALNATLETYFSRLSLTLADYEGLYLKQSFELGNSATLTFDKESLHRAIVKYAAAIDHCEFMAAHIEKVCQANRFEIEVSVDETDSPTSALEHLFWALELKRRNINIVSLAPRFIGHFEKGIDYKGDIAAFEASYAIHVAIANQYGPYKISVHSGSDKFSVYPIIGRLSGELLHVKTAGTSYLEALRCVARTNGSLFEDICDFSVKRYPTDKATYHVSVTDAFLANGLGSGSLEERFLNHPEGRQILHVAFGSVLTDKKQAFKTKILDNLNEYEDLHSELLTLHLGKHLDQLNAG